MATRHGSVSHDVAERLRGARRPGSSFARTSGLPALVLAEPEDDRKLGIDRHHLVVVHNVVVIVVVFLLLLLLVGHFGAVARALGDLDHAARASRCTAARGDATAC